VSGLTLKSEESSVGRNYLDFVEQSSIKTFLDNGGSVFVATDKRPLAQILQIVDLGQRQFSEKFVQEALAKWPEFLRQSVQLNGYGNLQTNKARHACKLFSMIESVGRLSLIEYLSDLRNKSVVVPPVLIQVNVGKEPQKSGFWLEDADMGVEQAMRRGLDVQGVMCIPPRDKNPSKNFRRIREIADRHNLQHCFFGMSDDYMIAIEEGSTGIRIGRAIFDSVYKDRSN
jgi:PLP dependent protein